MQSESNPYIGIWDALYTGSKSRGGIACMTGTVKSIDPLVVTCNGLDIDGDALLVNAALRKGYKRKVALNMPAYQVNGTVTSNAQTVKGIEAEAEESALQKGDMVLIIPSADMQTYHVVCRLEVANA